MICKVCLIDHFVDDDPSEAVDRLRDLIVAYVTARRARETYVHGHTGETMRGTDLLRAYDAAWAALVAEADRN